MEMESRRSIGLENIQLNKWILGKVQIRTDMQGREETAPVRAHKGPTGRSQNTTETSVNFYKTRWSDNPDDSHNHIHCCENLKSHKTRTKSFRFYNDVHWLAFTTDIPCTEYQSNLTFQIQN
jgi:hypothetical protein